MAWSPAPANQPVNQTKVKPQQTQEEVLDGEWPWGMSGTPVAVELCGDLELLFGDWGETQSWAGKAFYFLGLFARVLFAGMAVWNELICYDNGSPDCVSCVRSHTSLEPNLLLECQQNGSSQQGNILDSWDREGSQALVRLFSDGPVLRFKYLTTHHGRLLTRVSVWFSINSISHRQIKKNVLTFQSLFKAKACYLWGNVVWERTREKLEGVFSHWLGKVNPPIRNIDR